MPYHFHELHTLITECKTSFDIIGITESRLKKNIPPQANITLQGYNMEHCTTESTKGGALLYISSKHNYKVRNDLKLYKPKLLESVFIEILKPRKKNTIIGCVYRHPCMSVSEFNDTYLNSLLNKLSLENKSLIIMGDFNINLLNSDSDNDISDFLDQMLSNSLTPGITIPTRITPKSKTLIDNIFHNYVINDIISGNLTISISDHLAQFLIIPYQDTNIKPKSTHVFKRNYSKFNQEDFLLDLLSIDWEKHLQLNNKNVNYSFDEFLKIITTILDRYAPYKKVPLKLQTPSHKPWITRGILKSINVKNNLHKKALKTKNVNKKSHLFNTF